MFVYDLGEFDKNCSSIRQQDQNIYSDTEARCLAQPDSMLVVARLKPITGRPASIGREGINKIYELILDAEIYHAAAFVMTMKDGIASVEFQLSCYQNQVWKS